MPFQPKNKHWQYRKRNGKKKPFASNKELTEVANEYFEATLNAKRWVQVKYVGSEGKRVELVSPPPFTISGFCVHAGISRQAYVRLRNDIEFSRTIEFIDEIIWVHKFEGCCLGFFKEAIIARDLNLIRTYAHTGTDEEITGMEIIDE